MMMLHESISRCASASAVWDLESQHAISPQAGK